MEPVDQTGSAIAAVYARAILAIAQESGVQGVVAEQLDELVGLADRSPEFAHFLSATTVDWEARRGSLEKMFRGRLHDLVLDSLQVLNRKQRMGLVGELARQYRLALETAEHRIEIEVTTPAVLSDSLRTDLVEALRAKTGAEPVLNEHVDDRLIGGIVVRIGDKKMDYSVATQLRGLRRALLVRGASELHRSGHYIDES